MLPKVLVCCPTAKSKDYCFEDWLENALNFTYPNYEIAMFDNTNDNGESASDKNKIFSLTSNINDVKFNATKSNVNNSHSVIERMCISHNDCRDYMLKNDFDYMLHLESDVMPESDIIECLMFHKKRVVGGLYFTDEGVYRKVMIQQGIDVGFNVIVSRNFVAKEDIHFVDGSLKIVASVGLGCVLIHKSVFKNIAFRFDRKLDKFPDSYFAEDCLRNGFLIYADTSKIARHDNNIWIM